LQQQIVSEIWRIAESRFGNIWYRFSSKIFQQYIPKELAEWMGTNSWPARSPDLSTNYFFFKKHKIYRFGENRANDLRRFRLKNGNERQDFYNRLGYCLTRGKDHLSIRCIGVGLSHGLWVISAQTTNIGLKWALQTDGKTSSFIMLVCIYVSSDQINLQSSHPWTRIRMSFAIDMSRSNLCFAL
jgi:hypothetical protein